MILLVELSDELDDGGVLLADTDVDAGEGLGLDLLTGRQSTRFLRRSGLVAV